MRRYTLSFGIVLLFVFYFVLNKQIWNISPRRETTTTSLNRPDFDSCYNSYLNTRNTGADRTKTTMTGEVAQTPTPTPQALKPVTGLIKMAPTPARSPMLIYGEHPSAGVDSKLANWPMYNFPCNFQIRPGTPPSESALSSIATLKTGSHRQAQSANVNIVSGATQTERSVPAILGSGTRHGKNEHEQKNDMKETRILMGMPVTVDIVDDSGRKPSAMCDPKSKKFSNILNISTKNSAPIKRRARSWRSTAANLHVKNASDGYADHLRTCEETKQETDGYFDIKKPDGTYDPSGIVKGWAIWEAAQHARKRWV